MRTGVNAHIGITDIAYCSFNRSGGKVYYNFVPDLIADLFFGNQINGCALLFFVQFSDVRKMLIAENGQSIFRQLHVLQADGFERKINVFHPKISVIQLNDAADWQIIRFPEIFCLVVRAIFVQSSQIDVVARCPQLFRFCCPLLIWKTGHLDLAEYIFLRQQICVQNPFHLDGIVSIEMIVFAQLESNQRIRVLFFQCGVFLCGGTIQHRKLTLGLLSGSSFFLFLIGQVAVGVNHQVDISFHLRPAQRGFLMFRIMDKFQTFAIMVHKSAAAIQIVMGMSTDAVLLSQRFGTEFSVGLNLIQLGDTLLAVLKVGTLLQFMLDFSLRQNKSGGRFLALRSVDILDLFCFGGEDSIQKT